MKLSLGALILLSLLSLCLSDSAPGLSHVVKVGRNGRQVVHSRTGKEGAGARLGKKVRRRKERNTLNNHVLLRHTAVPAIDNATPLTLSTPQVTPFNQFRVLSTPQHATFSVPTAQVFSGLPVNQHVVHDTAPTFHQVPEAFNHHRVPHAPTNLFHFSHHGPAIAPSLSHFTQHLTTLPLAPAQPFAPAVQQVLVQPAPVQPAAPVEPVAPVAAPLSPSPAVTEAPSTLPEVLAIGRTPLPLPRQPLTLEYAAPETLYNVPAPTVAPAVEVEAVRTPELVKTPSNSYLEPAVIRTPSSSYLQPAVAVAPRDSYIQPAPIPAVVKEEPATIVVAKNAETVDVEAPINSYIEPAVIRTPSSNYLEPAVVKVEPATVREPTNSYIEPAVVKVEPVVVRAPTNSYIEPAVVKSEPVVVKTPTNSYIEPAVVKVEPVIVKAPTNSYIQPAFVKTPVEVAVVKSDVKAAIRSEPIAIIRSVLNAPDTVLAKKDGWDYSYESANGIKQEATGNLRLIDDTQVSVMRGSYQFLGVDNVVYNVEWYADETGFHATAPHLPQNVVPNHPEVAAAVKAQIAFAAAEDRASASSGSVVQAKAPRPRYEAGV